MTTRIATTARSERAPMAIPTPRGPVSAAVVAVVTGPIDLPPIVSSLDAQVERAVINSRDILTDDDLQLALFFLHALADGGIVGVDSRWAADGILAEVRRTLETALDEALRERLSRAPIVSDATDRLAAFLAEEATTAELDEFLAISAVSASCASTPELATALERAGLDCAPGHYLDAVDVRVITARTTATMLAATAPRGRAAVVAQLPPLAGCIASAAARFDVEVPLDDASGPVRTDARRFARDARRLVDHLAAAQTLDAWMHAESALRACDVIEQDRVLSAAALALRDVDVQEDERGARSEAEAVAPTGARELENAH
ncbi:hypothetical protein GCM10009792_23710 [Microcella alkalica]|uniref:Uncharacterized protein n=1 Tax=Microcella alkalica TaxID=355930 RepID=A0A839EB26_9MICO|nr:hypothetical protein [Microcella alkalica]MBA8848426.1 hypothetical protein [Microcella alkalica]